jgi:hypothetical protein
MKVKALLPVEGQRIAELEVQAACMGNGLIPGKLLSFLPAAAAMRVGRRALGGAPGLAEAHGHFQRCRHPQRQLRLLLHLPSKQHHQLSSSLLLLLLPLCSCYKLPGCAQGYPIYSGHGEVRKGVLNKWAASNAAVRRGYALQSVH